MKLPTVLREGFLQAMPEEERRRLGKAGMTQAEAEAVFKSGQEKELRSLVLKELNRRGAYVFHQQTNKRTRGPKGAPDLMCCYRGRFLAVELKAFHQTLQPDQAQEAVRIRNADGRFVLCFCVQDLMEELHTINRIADGLERPKSQ